MNERDRLNGIVECPCEQCRRRSDEAKEKTMRLPPEVKRAADRLERAIDATDDHDLANQARDLLAELRRFEKKLEDSMKDIDVEHPLFSTHAMRAVRS